MLIALFFTRQKKKIKPFSQLQVLFFCWTSSDTEDTIKSWAFNTCAMQIKGEKGDQACPN